MSEGVENLIYVAVGFLLGVITIAVYACLAVSSRTGEAARRMMDEDEQRKMCTPAQQGRHLRAM